MGWAGAMAGIGLGSSILGGIMGSKKSKDLKAAEQQQQALTKQSMEQADAQRKRGEEQWGITQGQFGAAGNIYNQLQGKAMQGIQNPFLDAAPQINEAARNTYQAERDLRDQGSRGGGTALAMAQNRLNMGRYASDATHAARQSGYQQLLGLGGAYDQRAQFMGGLMGQSNQLAQGYQGQAMQGANANLQYQASRPNPWAAVGQMGGQLLGMGLGSIMDSRAAGKGQQAYPGMTSAKWALAESPWSPIPLQSATISQKVYDPVGLYYSGSRMSQGTQNLPSDINRFRVNPYYR